MLTPKKVLNILNRLYVSNSFFKNIVLEGPPGIGKTSIVYQFAKQVAMNNNIPLYSHDEITSPNQFFTDKCPDGNCVVLIYLNINSSLPVDIAGIPDKVTDAKNNVYVKYVPLSWWIVCREAKYCIVFIDEYNTSESPDMIAVIMRLLGECFAGEVDLKCTEKQDGFTIVIAAGNPSNTNSVAEKPPAPLLGGKVMFFEMSPPTLHEFVEYMYNKHIDNWRADVVGFLANNPGYFYQIPESPRTDKPYPTPRGWEAVAVILHRLQAVDKDIVASLVGPDAATAYVSYVRTTPPSFDDILREEDPEKVFVMMMNYTAKGRLCEEVLTDGEVGKLAKVLSRLNAQMIASISYVASTRCKDKMHMFWSVVPEHAKPATLATRLVLSRLTNVRNMSEVINELL